MPNALFLQNIGGVGRLQMIVIVAVVIAVLAIASYFLIGGKFGSVGGAGFSVNVNTGADELAKASEASQVPDTNAFDETNPYGYKNPFR